VRRIEALTGAGAVDHVQLERSALEAVVSLLNVPPDRAADAVQRLQADLRRSAREAEQLKMKLALGGSSTTGSGAGADDSQDVNGVKLIARRLAGLEKRALRGLSDSLRDRLGSGVVVLASENDGKVALVVSVTKDLTSKVQAGRLVKELAPIVGGGGGGRPDFAEAGGKDPAGIDALLKKAPEVLKSQIQN
jgi:alanyl-tRNA synthetase